MRIFNQRKEKSLAVSEKWRQKGCPGSGRGHFVRRIQMLEKVVRDESGKSDKARKKKKRTTVETTTVDNDDPELTPIK